MRTLLPILMMTLLATACAKPRPEPVPPAPTPSPEPRAPNPAPPIPPPPPRSPTKAEKDAAQERALLAAELLENAKIAETRLELQRGLKLDPQNVLANTLLRQLDEDPTAILGKEFFSYKVKSGDTLSLIADHFLGDKYMFYAIARHNSISTPRNLQAGQVIKILGKQPKEVRPDKPQGQPVPVPVPTPVPPPQSTEAAAVRACDNAPQRYKSADRLRAAGRFEPFLEELDKSHQSYRECGRLGSQNAELMARREQLKRPLADGYYREAMKAYYNQDLDLAIHLLQRVLEVDPDRQLAADNLRKAKDLNNRLKLQSQQ